MNSNNRFLKLTSWGLAAYALLIGRTSLAQTGEGTHVAVKINAFDAILGASPIVQFVLLILVIMSIVSWAIIFAKRNKFSTLRKANEEFLDLFWKANSLDEVYERVEKYGSSPVSQVFKAGFVELQRVADAHAASTVEGSLKLIGIDNISRALRKAADIELSNLESRLNFLATTGSTGPFIGLFGTVWGIMNAFQKIGMMGSASLAVVAPGISEALIATAIGLAAAIPAVVGYNHFVNTIKKEELEISNFTSDFLNIVKRNFFKE
jgi:biopolymer transport protein TolQ